MAWDGYITNLMADGDIIEAAICGIDGCSIWACSPGFKGSLMKEEISALIDKRSEFPVKGVRLAGTKYCFLSDKMDDDTVYCLNVKAGLHFACVGKTLTALIIAVGKENVGGGVISEKVFKVVNYLRSKQY